MHFPTRCSYSKDEPRNIYKVHAHRNTRLWFLGKLSQRTTNKTAPEAQSSRGRTRLRENLTHWPDMVKFLPSRQCTVCERHPVRKFAQTATSGNLKCSCWRPCAGNEETKSVAGGGWDEFGHIYYSQLCKLVGEHLQGWWAVSLLLHNREGMYVRVGFIRDNVKYRLFQALQAIKSRY